MKKNTRYLFRATAFLMLTVLLSLGTISSASAAANKGLKLYNASFSDKTNLNRFKGAELAAGLLKTDKLKKSGMKLSATVYIPTKALKKDGDQISIDGYLCLQDPKAGNSNTLDGARDNWPYYLGEIETQYDFYLQYAKGKVTLKKHNWDTNKVSKAGSYASVKKSGNYYVVNLKNVPFSGYYWPPDSENPQKINTKKTFLLSPSILVISDTAAAWKGNIIVDNLKVKSAKKTQTVTFDKKDYRGLYGSNWQSGKAKWGIASTP